MRALASAFFAVVLLQSDPVAAATCLDDVAAFAVRICGEIANSGTSTIVDATGNVNANVSNIIRRVVGEGTANVSGRVLYDTYTGVLRDQLGPVQFNVIDCRQKMVNVAVPQVCQKASAPPRKVVKVCMGNGGGPSCAGGADAVYNCDAYSAMGGGSKLTYDTLAQRFCQYNDNGTIKTYPNQVIVTYNVGGGQCGWTAFQVTCNP